MMSTRNTRHLPSETPATRLVRPGVVQALGSKGDIYTVTIGERVSCDCAAGSYGRGCRHQRAAIEGWPAFWAPPARLHQRPANVVPFRARASDLYDPAA